MNGFQQSLIRFMYIALVLVLVLAGWSLLRPSAAAASAAQWDPSRGPQGVTATGTCVVRTNPEVVEVNLGVSQSSTTASAAKGYVKDTCAKIIAVLKRGGVESKNIQTQYFHLESVWQSGRGWEAKKWNADESLRVRIKDLDKVADLIDAAVNAGANRVGSLVYTVDDVNKLRAKGRAKAAEVARNKAAELAKALGGKLGKLTACSEGYPNSYGYYGYSPYYNMDSSGRPGALAQANVSANETISASSETEEITIQPGEMVITVVVTATYAVE